MKRVLILAVVVASALAASCNRYKYETVPDDPMRTRIHTLPNGLRIYMSVNRETPRLQTAIAVRVGSKNDPAETTGLAHYFEHLMFKGTEQFGTSDYAAEKPLLDTIEQLFERYRRTTDEAERAALYRRIDSVSYEASKLSIPNEYDKLMAALGANGTNAFTSEDMTVYVEDIPSNEIDAWARIQADRFRNPVIRGFHTELETIYEEKNMSLTRDDSKAWEALSAAIFPHHPYGTQTVLGTQEHLKNPSITNVRNYHRTYYVPNNMAVCVSGDFDPDELVAVIEKYFGDMAPNPDLPKLRFEPEAPIAAPVEREVFGLEAENVVLGWRLPAAADPSNDVAGIAAEMLSNGQAGLIDLDLLQGQQVLSAYAYPAQMADGGIFIMAADPKQGQTLAQARDLLLGEAAKLREGDFSEELIRAAVNNYRLRLMRQMEDNERALAYVYSFINGTDWADEVDQFNRLDRIRKEDVVAWARQYLAPERYAVVYKRQGEDKSVRKISAPTITPILTNRDVQSDFLKEIQHRQSAPIEPLFVDYETDMSQFDLREGMHVLYKKNELNDIFTLIYVFDMGRENDPALNLAFDYLGYLGTADRTADEIAREMYGLACSWSLNAGANQSTLTITGLSGEMGRAVEIVEELMLGAQPDEEILANLKRDILKARADAKAHQGHCFGALQRYMLYGPEFIARTTLKNPEIEALTSEELLSKVQSLMGKQHELLYYGPASQRDLRGVLTRSHRTPEQLEPLEKAFSPLRRTGSSEVVLAQYDAKQIYLLQTSVRDERFDPAAAPAIRLYNEYFGGGMNSVVFQEMREARGLAYSAWTDLTEPYHADGQYCYMAFIATQNDKMRQAIENFDRIIEQMPRSEAAFRIAKESLMKRLATERTVREQVLLSYLTLRELGLKEDRRKLLYDEIPAMTLEDVEAAQAQWVKGRPYTYGILGDADDLDTEFLGTLGPVRRITPEEMFGY